LFLWWEDIFPVGKVLCVSFHDITLKTQKCLKFLVITGIYEEEMSEINNRNFFTFFKLYEIKSFNIVVLDWLFDLMNRNMTETLKELFIETH